MARKTNKAAAIDAADKLSENLDQLGMLGDLLSMADDSITDETILIAGNTIWQLVDGAHKARAVVTDRWANLEKGGAA